MSKKTFKLTKYDLFNESIKQDPFYKQCVGKVPVEILLKGLVLKDLTKSIKDYILEFTFSGSLLFSLKINDIVYSTFVPEISDADEEEIYNQSAQALINSLTKHIDSFKEGDKVIFEVIKNEEK